MGIITEPDYYRRVPAMKEQLSSVELTGLLSGIRLERNSLNNFRLVFENGALLNLTIQEAALFELLREVRELRERISDVQ